MSYRTLDDPQAEVVHNFLYNSYHLLNGESVVAGVLAFVALDLQRTSPREYRELLRVLNDGLV